MDSRAEAVCCSSAWDFSRASVGAVQSGRQLARLRLVVLQLRQLPPLGLQLPHQRAHLPLQLLLLPASITSRLEVDVEGQCSPC